MSRGVRSALGGAIAAVALLVCLTLALDPGGYLGTDTGGKVATLEVMSRTGSWEPGVGYWAEEADPEGRYHPLYSTLRVEDAWVQVTTLPMIYAARPLYELGGYRLALLLPILGSVGAALAARALAVRLGFERPAIAFWVFVLASPMLVYALDLWEHSLGVALMSWAFVGLLDVVERRRRWWISVGSGALLAGAATMRTEALVYTAVMVGVCCGALALARRFGEAMFTGAGAVAGFVPVWLGYAWLEGRVNAPSRSGRATGAAETGLTTVPGAGGGAPANDTGMIRLEEGIETLLSVRADGTAAAVLFGLLLVIVIGVLVRLGERLPRRILVGGSVFVALVYLLVILSGLGFVNGLVGAFPVAAAAIGFDQRNRAEWIMISVALLALPVVWAFQFVGGAGPQWGGRYVLESGFLLGVVGVVSLWRRRTPELVRWTVVGASLAVSIFGFVWLASRTHQVADAFEDVERVEGVEAVVARNPFILREGGAAFLDEQWLSANLADSGDVSGAFEVFRERSIERVAVLQEVGGRDVEGEEPLERIPVDFLGVAFELVVYDLG